MRGANWGRAAARSIGVLLVLALNWVFFVPAAHSADLQLGVAVASLTSTGTKASDTVTIKAIVTNTTAVPLYGVQVYLWRSKDAIRDQYSLEQAAAGASTWGGRLSGPGRYLQITNTTTPFEPGASRAVTLTASVAQLGFDTTAAAYAIGLDVIGNTDQSSTFLPLAQVRSFVPMPAKQPVPLTSVVLLSAAPTKLASNLFANENLSADLTGRLGALLNAALDSGRSWLIDPALLDEVHDQADGYQVFDGKTRQPGAGQQVAQDWLARFGKLDRNSGARTLFGNPDTYSAQINDKPQLLGWSKTATASVAGLDDLPLVIVPTGEVVNKAGLDFLASAGANAIMASNVRGAGALQTTSTGTPLLAVASGLTGDQATDPSALLLQNQYILAETALSGHAGQVRLLTSPDDLAQDSATRPSWVTERDLGETLERPALAQAGLLAAKPAHLSDTQWGSLRRVSDDFSTYNDLVPDSEITNQPDASFLRILSASWIGQDVASAAYVERLSQLVGRAAVLQQVRLDASPRFVMSARSNQFPVTVTNELTEPIRVRVIVTTDNPQRLTVPASELTTVGPGQSQTVNIRPEASANGVVTASAFATTASGRRVSSDISLTIEVTDLGVVAWFIVGASAIVLVAATAWRIRQVRRRDAALAAASAPVDANVSSTQVGHDDEDS